MENKTTAILLFHEQHNQLMKKKELRHGLSVAVQVGNTLWVTNDETITLERLTFERVDGDGNLIFADHTQFPLHDYLSLPAPPTKDDAGNEHFEEADIEGLSYADGYLWLVGSHSLKRGKADKKNSEEENLKSLAKTSSDGNRYLLARIPVEKDGGTYTLKKEVNVNGKKRCAAQIKGNDKRNEILKKLKKDEHLGAFISIPGKDNGFDIEGIAVEGSTIFLGLRGPVLRGWAIILCLEIKKGKKEKHPVLRIKNMEKHFLQLDGLGIRDLIIQEKDLLVLAGPTMDLDGPVKIFRWKGGAQTGRKKLVFRKELELVIDVPYGNKDDHAEGMTLFSRDGTDPQLLLIVYDSACKARLFEEKGVKADIFPLKKNPLFNTENTETGISSPFGLG